MCWVCFCVGLLVGVCATMIGVAIDTYRERVPYA